MATVVSAPGKVLIAGGYLVLDHRFPGLVVSTSSRFYTVVQPTSGEGKITVKSPQFENAEWVYDVVVNGDSIQVQQKDNSTGSKNSFVQTALEGTLAIALATRGKESFLASLGQGLDIHVLAHNDFYSQRASLTARNLPPTLDSLNSIPPFLPQGCSITKVHKTGLGSSASLITSLVSALLLHFGAIPSDSLSSEASSSRGRELAHNVSQYVHCLAQGKVGSGFDVSSAVFGSQVYQRFEPGVIADIMQGKPSASTLLSTLSPSNKAWNHVVSPFKLPPLTRMMLADVDSGSDTPSMVGNVLKWKKAEPTVSDQLWEGLDKCNHGLGDIINRLSQKYEEDPTEYANTVDKLARDQGDEWERHSPIEALEVTAAQLFGNTRRLTKSIRDGMRAMGKSSSVPIEPPEQTQLLDACCALPGVIGGGVPGAGGYDAIWLLVLQPQDKVLASSVMSSVEQLWQNWTGMSVSPLLATESLERGARKESMQDVPGLEATLKGSA
ncbi:phosphomevalonate kinase-like protein, putative [Rhizoctonia solani AG-3 Rhs1AP]|uniref:Phosphomevalonate kinase n=1 Tax=Rhizoctonia solani AG-3 Rhs1AP TaxID=1086054 RepID=X8JKX1_9AGAM|nr:phosphomevalonate kinase-like protein, putative [Rhizoctonia solani AG-3 Rhs1AP]